MLQIVLTLAIFVILVIPTGRYMYHIASNQKTFADPVFDRLTRLYTESAGFRAGTWDGKNTRCPF